MTPYQGRHTKLQTYTTESITPGYFLRQKQQPAKESQQSIIKILHRPTYHKLVNMLMTLLHSNSMLGRNGGLTADQKLLPNLTVTLDVVADKTEAARFIGEHRMYHSESLYTSPAFL